MGRMEYFDPQLNKRVPAKAVSIVNDDGLEYRPEDVQEIDNKINNLSDDVSRHKEDKIQHTPYAIASGTNSYAVNIPGITSLIEGMSVKVNFTSANTGACTLNINGLGAKPIQKSNGNALSSGNIKAGQICHLVYTGSSFQLLGEGGEYGTAQSSDVLEGKTIGTESGIITGTMTNRGAVSKTITTQGGTYTIPKGYHSGSGRVKAQFANLIASNIKKDVNVGGVVGTLASVSSSISESTFTIEEFQSRTVSMSSGKNVMFVYATTSDDSVAALLAVFIRGVKYQVLINGSTITVTNLKSTGCRIELGRGVLPVKYRVIQL